MIRRRFSDLHLGPNDILIRQKEDTLVLHHEDQSVINWVKSNVHRYHAKMKDGILYAAQLNDNDSSRYTDNQPAAVTNLAVGDTMVYIPKFYATLLYQSGDVSIYHFSKETVNEQSFAFGDVFIGAYGGDYTNNTLNSISHPASTTGTYKTKEQLQSMAAAKGNGYTPVTLEDHNLVGLLYVAIHHNTDCKSTLGAGAATYDRPCGTTTSIGMKESKPGDAYTSFLGIENWWGGRYEVLGNIVANNGTVDGIYHVTERDGSSRQIQSIAPTSQWMYPRKMILGRRFDIVADPSCYAGEITSGHGWHSEQYMRNEADRVVIRGGFMADISSGFAFLAARFTNTESGTYNTMTGRLSYKGDHEFVEIDTYREMFDPDWVPPVTPEEYDINNAPDGAYVYTSDNKLMNIAAYEQSGKTINDVYGIAVLDGNYRYCIDPRIKSKLQMNVTKPVTVPLLNAYGENDTGSGLYTCWYIMGFEKWCHSKAPSFWFALNSTFKYGETGYLPSYGEAKSMQKNQSSIADIITSLGFEMPSPSYHTSTFPSSINQNYSEVMSGGFDYRISMGSTSFTTECTSLPICPLMEHNRDYFRLNIDEDQTDNLVMSLETTKNGIVDDIIQNTHRYLCKYVNGVMNVCQLNDNNSNFFYDGTPAILSGEQGDVMVMTPKFYHRIRSVSRKHRSKVGYIQKDYQDKMYEYGGRLIGAYQSSMVNGVIRSVSGRPVLSGVSKNQFDAYVKERGNDFSLLRHEDCDIIALLFMLKYNNLDWESQIGGGAYVENSTTGVTSGMGMTNGVSSDGRINIFGLEDFWGNGYEYIGNARYGYKEDSSKWIIYNIYDNDPSKGTMFDMTDDPKNELIFCGSIATRFLAEVDYVDYSKIAIVPSTNWVLESAAGIKSQCILSDQQDRAVVRGGCNDGAGNGYGLAYINTMFGPDDAGDAKNRSRIMYNGEMNIINNVQDFLNL